MSQESKQLTETDAINSALQALSEGDEVTIIDSFDMKVNDTVSHIEEGRIHIGELGSVDEFVLTMNPPQICEMTADNMDPISSGADIDKLQVWDE